MLLHFCNDKKEINYNKYMVYTNILLILVTVLCVILLANRTKNTEKKVREVHNFITIQAFRD